jgi:hypothetical protein
MNELMRYLRVQWDRVGAVVAAVAGVVVLILGWVGTSGTEYIAEQIPYVMSGGLAGLVLLIVAAVLWLSADLRDEWRELAAQGDALRAERAERRGELQAYIDSEVTRRLAAGSRGGDSG